MKILHLISLMVLYEASLSMLDSGLSDQFNLHAAKSTSPSVLRKTTTMSDDSLFQQVPLDTNTQAACSPTDPGIDWRGVLIRAPSRIVLPKENSEQTLIIPICGLYLVDVANTFRHPGPKILIAVDSTSGKTYKGALVKRPRERIIPPPPSRPVNPNSKAAFGNYFNVNAADYIVLPLQPAHYRLKIEYAGYQSNEVVIEITDGL